MIKRQSKSIATPSQNVKKLKKESEKKSSSKSRSPQKTGIKNNSRIMDRLLDYNPLPSKNIQNKINYYMTPYNSSVIHEKFIDFKYSDDHITSNFYFI